MPVPVPVLVQVPVLVLVQARELVLALELTQALLVARLTEMTGSVRYVMGYQARVMTRWCVVMALACVRFTCDA